MTEHASEAGKMLAGNGSKPYNSESLFSDLMKKRNASVAVMQLHSRLFWEVEDAPKWDL